MIHIGSKDYYHQVSLFCNDLHMILMEGVPLKRRSGIGNYRRTAKLFGMITQGDGLEFDDDFPVRNIDISQDRFDVEYTGAGFDERMQVLQFRLALLLLSFNKKKSLESLIRYFAYTGDQPLKLIDPANHYTFKHGKSPFDHLISNVRDEIIAGNFQDYIRENRGRKYRYDTGILFGDNHMPVFYGILKQQGYKWKMVKKIEVF